MTRKMAPISAFVICKDEVSSLGCCLESLDICREIVVVDSGSTDGTLDLIESYRARGLPIRLIKREWPGYAKQKQFALEQATGPWCLSLDADERLDDEARQMILSLPLDETDRFGYALRRKNHLYGYGFPPDLVHAKGITRLFRKSRAHYDLSLLVHEALIHDGPIRTLKRGSILHHHHASLEERLAKNEDYSSLKARERIARGRTSGPFKLLLNPLGRFLKIYLLQRYFICGTPGLVNALLHAHYTLLTELKILWPQLQAGRRSKPDAR